MLRNCLSLTTAALLCLPGLTHAQGPWSSSQPSVQLGVRAGLSRSVLDGLINQETEFRNGLHAGVFLRCRLAPHVALQPEINFAQQGTESYAPNGVLPLKSTTRLNYLNVPVLLKVYLGQVFNVQVGPQLGVLLRARRAGELGWKFEPGTGAVSYITGDVNAKPDFRGDAGLVFGLGTDLKNGLTVSARANYGLRDINNSASERRIREILGIDGGIHNRGLELSVGYAFGSSGR